MIELPDGFVEDLADYIDARINLVTMQSEMAYHNVIHSRRRQLTEQNKIDRFEKKWLPSRLTLTEQIKS